eukprot:gene294-318_t
MNMNFNFDFKSPNVPNPFTVLRNCKMTSELIASMMFEEGKSLLEAALAINDLMQELHREESTINSGVALLDLSQDLLFVIFQYLTPPELALMTSSVCRGLEPSLSNVLQVLWRNHIVMKWDLPHQCVNWSKYSFSCTELRRLYPFCRPVVHPSFIAGLGIQFNGSIASYRGPVGESNRAVMTLTPFSALPPALSIELDIMNSCSLMLQELSTVARGKKSGQRRHSRSSLDNPSPRVLHSRPFTFLDLHKQPSLFLHPHSVSYFEVFLGPDGSPGTANVRANDGGGEEEGRGNECVAVGLATRNFAFTERLPGWDGESFGYHGDDGAIFHGHGKHLSSYGPRFGVGDVVGCGLCYADRTIFFTLNGNFLGSAFSDLNITADLFPTVGVDANCTIDFNFGDRPFKFDLYSFICHNRLTLLCLQ